MSDTSSDILYQNQMDNPDIAANYNDWLDERVQFKCK